MAMKDRMVQRHPLVGCMDMDAENAHRIATAIARILQQTSGRFFKRPSAWIRTALSNWATGARSARGASVSTTPCTLVSDSWSGKGNMEKESVRGLQVQRPDSAPTLSGMCPHHHPGGWSLAGPCPLEAHRFADTHHKIYAERCAELGLSPHPRTQPKKDPGKRYARLDLWLDWLLTSAAELPGSQAEAFAALLLTCWVVSVPQLKT